MIRYTLKCDKDHSFESWFQNASAFDALAAARQLSCPDCGSSHIAKTLMAPPVPAKSNRKTSGKPGEKPAGPLTASADPREKALAELRRKVEENSDYVGMNFAAEARAMHDGDAPARSIYGEASLGEAKSLIEDGIPVAPVPFRPRSKTN